MKIHKNFINGKWVLSSSGETFADINPANPTEIIGKFPKSNAKDVDTAVKAAQDQFDEWRRTPAPKRGEILYCFGQLLTQHKEEIARLMTREMGKVLKETRGDVQEAIDMAFYAAGEGRRLFGQTTPSELQNKAAFSIRMPIGVCGIITPWNFPAAIPAWKILPALICGNTVVFKPASWTPATAARFVELLDQAGIPKGVVNLVHGTGDQVGEALIRHPGIDLISFTGSCETGRKIGEICGRALKNHSLELGGKNVQIVMEDADLKLAVEGALWGAFGTTGQRCTATSRLIVHKKVLNRFTRELVRRAKSIKIGNGLDLKTEMGPLISESQRERVHRYVQIGVKEGAKLLFGGKYVSRRGGFQT
ncbi:MAG: aldehyde dehydrogenase family protein, partial [Candidatus Omnitrophica bacterium]|nr:aldehyde dehydrogenase family protein [Candidatus Omnitrophota bacterium]